MTKPGEKSPITIKFEISIPTDLGAGVRLDMGRRDRHPERLAVIHHPPDAGETYVRPCGDMYLMCANGTVGGARHIAARVYSEGFDVTTLGQDPPQPTADEYVRIIYVDGLTHWQIEELPVLPPLTERKKLVLWSEEDCQYIRHTTVPVFQPIETTYTYCDYFTGSPVMAGPGKTPKPDWSKLPERWLFRIKGCTNLKCKNCDCLNGEWVLRRDKSCSKTYRWYFQMKESFTDPKRSAYWRLVFNNSDGFFYLDCVEQLDQGIGTWISYRRHESAWNPTGPNEMHLVSNGGYCNVPESVTVIPA